MVDTSHGPNHATDLASKGMIKLVLRKGTTHKDKFTGDCAIGFWRHKEYITCPIGMLAMETMVHFFSIGNGITFDLHYQKFPNFWRNIPTIRYAELEDDKAEFINEGISSWALVSSLNKLFLYIAFAMTVGGLSAKFTLSHYSIHQAQYLSYILMGCILGVITACFSFFLQVGAFTEEGITGMWRRRPI